MEAIKEILRNMSDNDLQAQLKMAQEMFSTTPNEYTNLLLTTILEEVANRK